MFLSLLQIALQASRSASIRKFKGGSGQNRQFVQSMVDHRRLIFCVVSTTTRFNKNKRQQLSFLTSYQFQINGRDPLEAGL